MWQLSGSSAAGGGLPALLPAEAAFLLPFVPDGPGSALGVSLSLPILLLCLLPFQSISVPDGTVC